MSGNRTIKNNPPLYSMQIRFEHFRERILGILMQIRGDTAEIDRAIKEIQDLNPPAVPTFAATDGFADIYAKAKIMELASHAITPSYYMSLTSRKQLFIQGLFNEETESENLKRKSKKIKSNKHKYELNYENIAGFQRATTAFFVAWDADKVNPLRQSPVELKEVAPDSRAFTRPFVDVEMEEEEWKALTGRQVAIGSKGMATCIYVHLKGRQPAGPFIAGCSHLSSPTPEIIQAMLDDAIKEMKLLEESLQVYLIGGCIINMPNYLNILSLGRTLRIRDVRLCSINTFEQEHNAVMEASDPKRLLFSVNSSLSGFDDIARSNQRLFYRARENFDLKRVETKSALSSILSPGGTTAAATSAASNIVTGHQSLELTPLPALTGFSMALHSLLPVTAAAEPESNTKKRARHP